MGEHFSNLDALQVVHAIVATLAVVLPLIVMEARRRSRLSRAKYFMELIDTREALTKRLGIVDHIQEPPEGGAKVLADLEDEFKKLAERKVSRFGFYVAAAVEVFLFALLIFGFNAGYGIRFLEGVWEHPGLRFGLTLAIVSLSVGATIYAAELLERKRGRIIGGSFSLFILFNLLFIVLSVATSLFLIIVDPYTNAF